jgi:hypothetical protein
MKNRNLRVLIALTFLASLRLATAQGTAFIYQGQLNANGVPANGSYDLTFALYTNSNNGTATAGPITNLAVAVSNGLFTTTIDFGADAFTGSSNWLQIGARTNGAPTFSLLTPSQQIMPAPYALYAPNAGFASTAGSANSVAASNVSGTLGLVQLPAALLTNGQVGVNISGTFAGNGGGLTSIPLSGITQPGALVGQSPVFNGTNWVPTSVGGAYGTVQNLVPATSPYPIWFSPSMTNGTNIFSGNQVIYSQLSGNTTDGTNQYCIFNVGVDARPLTNMGLVVASNYNYPSNYFSYTNAWTFCGGKVFGNQLVAVANNFNATNEFSSGFTASTGTQLYFFSLPDLNLVSIMDISNTTGQNMEDFCEISTNSATVVFGYFTFTPPYITNYTTYDTTQNPWQSNGVISLSYPIYKEGGLAFNRGNGNVYIAGNSAYGYAQADTNTFNGVLMTNLDPAYYYQFNPFFNPSVNTATPSLQLLTLNPTYGTVNVVLQYSTSANYGYGSPEFISNNWTTVYQSWNWIVGTNIVFPFDTPAPTGYSYYCTNDLTAYSLVESNISMVSFNSGLTLMDDTWINTLWTENINPWAMTTVGDTLAQSIVIGPAGTVNYSSFNNGWGSFIQTPMVSFPSEPGSLPVNTNVMGTTGNLLLIQSVPGLRIELAPGGIAVCDFAEEGSFGIGPGGRYNEALQMSSTGNLTLSNPGEYIGNGGGLTNLHLTNSFNTQQPPDWIVWKDTNSLYHALAGNNSAFYGSNDFSGLMNLLMANATGNAATTFALASSGGNAFVALSTIFVTTPVIFVGQGDPATTIELANGSSGPIFQLGTSSAAVSGIVKFDRIRFMGNNANDIAIVSTNCSQPAFEDCEINNFGADGIVFGNVAGSEPIWSYCRNCFFVNNGATTNVASVLFCSTAGTNGDSCELHISQCLFSTSGNGVCIEMTNGSHHLTVDDCRFWNQNAFFAVPAIEIAPSSSTIQILNNHFQWWYNNASTLGMINFEANSSPLNVNALIADNLCSLQGSNFITSGANVSGIASFGNASQGYVAFAGDGYALTNLQSSNLVGGLRVDGYGSTATNTYSMSPNGYTNTGTKNIRIFDLTGASLVFSNSQSMFNFAMTNTTYPFVVISPNESITGTGCQADAMVDF